MLSSNRYPFKLSSQKMMQRDTATVSDDSQSFSKPQRFPAVRSIDGILKPVYVEKRTQPKVVSETVIEAREDKNVIVDKVVSEQVVHEIEGVDPKKRSFLKLASMAGLGAVAISMIPKKAEAYVMGATPTSSVVGVKNASNTRVNPATEETLQTLISGQSVLKQTVTLTNSGTVITPSSGKKIRVYSTRFSLTSDLGSVSFRFTSGGTDYEKYVSPKAGGLYGANNHPNFVEGGVNQEVYCVLSASATVQINVDYLEV